MKKNIPILRKSKSYSQFLTKLEEIPWPADVWQIIKQLQHKCLYGTQRESKRARDLLKQAGIPRFIPKDSTQRKTENPKWRERQIFYPDIILMIWMYRNVMMPGWKKGGQPIRKAYFAFEEFWRTKPIDFKQAFKKITRQKASYKSPRHFALAVYAYYHDNIPFSKLCSLYFRNQNWKRARKKLEDGMKQGIKRIDFP
jgi:hypothetical protein